MSSGGTTFSRTRIGITGSNEILLVVVLVFRTNSAIRRFKLSADLFSLSWGRVLLLGIAQRTIRVFCTHIPTNRQLRKPLPTSIQTLGDLIQVKRYEKRLTLPQLAEKMGIATASVRAWEDGSSQPDTQQMALLAKFLDFDGRYGLADLSLSPLTEHSPVVF